MAGGPLASRTVLELCGAPCHLPSSILSAILPDFHHYRIETDPAGRPVELGRGAMGVTYLATDSALHIRVALKVITPARTDDTAAQALFLREARAAARVRHSNVASVLFLSEEPGRIYYAMEFIAGESLRAWLARSGPPEPRLALAIAEQIARGLEAIHVEGIIHRDLKPSNVMLLPTPRAPGTGSESALPPAWQVKIIDFGLARPVAGPDESVGTIGFRGTAAYASPEQCAERTDLDGRTDLYALGCILFEMLAGGPLFKARTQREMADFHLDQPPPLERIAHAPAPLREIVARLLAKRPSDRPESAAMVGEMFQAARFAMGAGTTVFPGHLPLRSGSTWLGRSRWRRPTAWLALVAVLTLAGSAGWIMWRRADPGAETPFTTPAPGLAVLPFEQSGAEGTEDFLADGLHADLLDSLRRVRGLPVIARASVDDALARGGGGDLRRLGAELGVGNFLAGNVRRVGDRVRISVRLTEAKTGRTRWSQTYERDAAELLAVEGQIALEVATRLRGGLSPEERTALMRPATGSASAYTHFLRARALMSDSSRSRDALDGAIRALGLALDADPSYALAYAQLSMAHTFQYFWGHDRTDQRLELARTAAEAALRYQPSLPEGKLALALYHYRGFRDYARALPLLEEALASLPGNAEVLSAIGYIRRRQGKWDEGAALLARAAEASPLDPILHFNFVSTLVCLRHYERADQMLELARRRMPGHPALEQVRGDLYRIWKGDLGPMREELAKRAPDTPTVEVSVFDRVDLLLSERKFDEALRLFRESRFVLLDGQNAYFTRDSLEAEILTQTGRTEEARPLWRRAATRLAELAAARPTDARLRVAYATALAGTGQDSADALAEGRAAAALVPLEKDAFDAPFLLHRFAVVLIRCGQIEEARKIVHQLETIPCFFSREYFRLSPAFDAVTAQ